ncbi:unnamed protein product [Linum trigynum]|uniref:Uncharacterized protein n=1 Tax=Linum trigynum TaxID=586398 RepID=A0AAV2FAJ7_9ROSI
MQGYVLLWGIGIANKCAIHIRGRRILGQLKSWKFRKKGEVFVGLYGVDGDFIHWWKRRKKWNENPIPKGKLQAQAKKEPMTCTLDCCYIDKVFGDKIYKLKRDAEATAATDIDNSESIVIESPLPLPTKQSMVPSAVNLDTPTLMITTYDKVISRRSCKSFRKRRVWAKIANMQATSFEEQMNKWKRDEQAEGGEVSSAIWVDLWTKPAHRYGLRMKWGIGRRHFINDPTYKMASVFNHRFIKLGLEDKAVFQGLVMMSVQFVSQLDIRSPTLVTTIRRNN